MSHISVAVLAAALVRADEVLGGSDPALQRCAAVTWHGESSGPFREAMET